jgi:hypothetical protein
LIGAEINGQALYWKQQIMRNEPKKEKPLHKKRLNLLLLSLRLLRLQELAPFQEKIL